MWNMKYVYNGNNGSHRNSNKSFKKIWKAIAGKLSLDSLQSAIVGTSHIIRNILRSETWSLNGGRRRWFRRSTTEERHVIIIIIIRSQRHPFNNTYFPVRQNTHPWRPRRQNPCSHHDGAALCIHQLSPTQIALMNSVNPCHTEVRRGQVEVASEAVGLERGLSTDGGKECIKFSLFCILCHLKGLGHHDSLTCECVVRTKFKYAWWVVSWVVLSREAFAVSLRMSSVQHRSVSCHKIFIFRENLCLTDRPALPERESNFFRFTWFSKKCKSRCLKPYHCRFVNVWCHFMHCHRCLTL